ncbi:MAG: class I SAM-dependent methyltransferase [Planctomycetes bacterium]|nr:class I SAM-dependent methyltransferase [Planctomycetota bacterium]
MASSGDDSRFLWSDTPEAIEGFRSLVGGYHYDDRTICELLGIKSGHSLSERDLSTLLAKTEQRTPLNALVRLFLVGVPVEAGWIEEVIAPMRLADWEAAGLVQVEALDTPGGSAAPCRVRDPGVSREAGSVRGRIKLVAFQGLLVAFDLPPWVEGGRHEDYVMGIGSSTLTLANLTIRRRMRRALDLGTGCGILALLAARHCDEVVAVDRNARAVRFAAFNARLNGLKNVSCRQSDLFSGVAGQPFDLVVCNPPFVVSPETSYIYRDGGVAGDGLVQSIVRQVPAVLVEGGFCQMLCNWAHIEGQDWQARLRDWGRGTGCDVWAMRSDTLDAEGYAAKWIRHTERDDPEHYQQRFEAWTEYYRSQRIEAVSGGLITMRRRAARPDESGGGNWFRGDDAPEKMLGSAGEDVAGAFEARDFLDAARDDAVLLRQRLKVSPHVVLKQSLRPSAEGWATTEASFHLEQGLAYSGQADPFVANLVARCDGSRTLGELMDGLAGELGKPAVEIAPVLLDVVRRLIERRFLLNRLE